MLSEPVMTSPPDRDLAARILERAQMAQMTRKLKLGLSQVPTNNHNGHINKHNDAQHEKTNLDHIEHAPLRPLETRKRITAIPQDSKETSPLKKHSSALLKNPKELSKKDNFVKPKSPMKNKDAGSIPVIKVPSTPGRSSSSSNIQTTPKRKITRILHGDDITSSNNGNNTDAPGNSTGADLLIYLATSPYTKNESNASTRIKIPTTPRASTFGQLGADDTIRLSHLKPSLTSPQSTFKNIHHNGNGDIISGNGTTIAFNNMLLESPSLYNSTGTLASTNGNNSNNSNGNSHLNTTSNVNASGFNPNLLKTPNFNMGDYIHNLFSPSPNVNINNINKERSISNLKRNSISNSLAQVALLSTSGITASNGNNGIIDDQISRDNSNEDNNKNHNNANINDNNNI